MHSAHNSIRRNPSDHSPRTSTEQPRFTAHEPSVGSASDQQHSASSSLHSIRDVKNHYHEANDDLTTTDFASISQRPRTAEANLYTYPSAQQPTYMNYDQGHYGQWGNNTWTQQPPAPYPTAFPFNAANDAGIQEAVLQESAFDNSPMPQRSIRIPSIGDYPEQLTPGEPRKYFSRSRQNTVVDSAVVGVVADSVIDMQLSRHKLKATSRTSALLAGFAMVALVELDLQGNNYVPPPMLPNETATAVISPVPKPVLILFAVVTTLLVSVHLLAMMMGTCMLPHMEALGTSVHNSPHHKLRYYIELSWFFSTCLGLILFLAEIGIIFWVKFIQVNYHQAAAVATILLIPIFFIFMLFTYHFYRKLMAHHFTRLHSKLKQIQQEDEEELRKFNLEERRNQEMYIVGNMA